MDWGIRHWVALGASLFLLNSALSFHNVWPTLWIEVRPELSVEAAIVVLVLVAMKRFAGSASGRFMAVIASVLVLMVLGRYLEVTAPALYGRAVNLYWDAQYLPDVAAMFAASASWLQMAGLVLGVTAVLVAAWLALYLSLRCVRAALGVPKVSTAVKLGAWFLVGAYFLGYYTSLPTLRWFAIPVSHTYTTQARLIMDAVSGKAAALVPDEQPLEALAVEDLPATDVLVTFVESYGAVAYDDPGLDQPLGTARKNFEAAVGQSGRSVMSAYVEAPTFGGGSWLSHISFMSGLNVSESAIYDALLREERVTLPKLFGSRGFRTVALMPGLKNTWPEGSFYGFDRIYGSEALQYEGPEFGWWQIPDQFSLARLDALELAAGARPRAFVFFPTISTHAPFHVPPYQPDWDRLVTEVPYSAAELGNTLSRTSTWTDLKPAYRDSIAYTYDYWAGYLERTSERDYLLVLVGDHQPPASVSGEGARWDVPVHVVTRDEALQESLALRGFVRGMVPEPAPAAGMHDLALMLFQ